jgi:transposase-like protein
MVAAAAPKTLQEAAVYFSNPDNCLAEMVKLRWQGGPVVCPSCGSERVSFLKSRRVWECAEKHARRQFSVKVGTVMEDSAIGLDKWLLAMWLIPNAKNGISSYELSRSIGVTQKSAWFMLHRIRLAMQDANEGGKLGGDVEIDETYIGGKARNLHKGVVRRRGISKQRSMAGKVAVLGLLSRHPEKGESRIRMRVIKGRKVRDVQPSVYEHVEPGSTLYTDAFCSYYGLEENFVHHVIDHAESYVEGNVHTNGLENFWSLLKRSIKGTYVSVEPFHLFRYLDEQAFRFNHRKLSDAARFAITAASVVGKRLTFKTVTGTELPQTC